MSKIVNKNGIKEAHWLGGPFYFQHPVHQDFISQPSGENDKHLDLFQSSSNQNIFLAISTLMYVCSSRYTSVFHHVKSTRYTFKMALSKAILC